MHPDERVAKALRDLEAEADAVAAANDLFSTWDDFAAFFLHVFDGRSKNLEQDLEAECIVAEYTVDDFGLECEIRPGHLLYLLGFSGISPSKDARFCAEFMRVCADDPTALSAYDPATVVEVFEDVRDFSAEQLAVFRTSSIGSRAEREYARKCLVSYSLPVEYVRGMRSSAKNMVMFSPGTIYEVYRYGVPLDEAKCGLNGYFSLVAQDKLRDMAVGHDTIGSDYPALYEKFKDADLDPVGWYIVALHAAEVPGWYVDAVRRTPADIIELHRCGVPLWYVTSVPVSAPADAIVTGFRDNIPAEYMAEMFG